MFEVGQILAAVQCGHGAGRELVKNREMELVDVKVQHVELRRHLPHLVEHQHVVWNGIAHRWIEPKRLCAARHELCGGDGLPAGEQRDIMALRHQSLGEIADDSFRASVEARRHAFDQGGNLRNSHWLGPPSWSGRSDTRLYRRCALRDSRKRTVVEGYSRRRVSSQSASRTHPKL